MFISRIIRNVYFMVNDSFFSTQLVLLTNARSVRSCSRAKKAFEVFCRGLPYSVSLLPVSYCGCCLVRTKSPPVTIFQPVIQNEPLIIVIKFDDSSAPLVAVSEFSASRTQHPMLA